MLKQKLKEKFKEAYPDKRILAINLNGFSHSVFFDNGNKNSSIEREVYSAYSPEQKTKDFNTEQSIKLFKGIGHLQYQNNPKQLLYVDPKDR